jgi:rare lipoprotein A (peptidoglycan hydrolase)
MSLYKWRHAFLATGLMGALAISGCSSEQTGEQGKPNPQEKEGSAATSEPGHKEAGKASWYGPGVQGHETANGEAFNPHGMTAAHPSLPMGTKAEVTNLGNGKKVEVTINDRGPYAKGRAIDLSSAAANKLDMKAGGTAKVKIETKHPRKKRSSARTARPSSTH